MIRTFSQLTRPQREVLFRLLMDSGNPLLPRTLEEMTRLYAGPAYTEGATHWSFWREDSPVAALGAVTEAWTAKHEVYLTGICVSRDAYDALDALWNVAFPALAPWTPCRLKLGANAFVPGLSAWAETHGLSLAYRLLEMCWDPSRLVTTETATRLVWHPVTPGNADAFMEVNNAAFLHSPNGGVLDVPAVRALMAEAAAHPELLSIGCLEETPVAALTLLWEPDGKGLIDGIAVHPHHQGKGFGREAVRHAVGTLRRMGASEIVLTVMDSNLAAVHLYEREGFARTRVLSHWYEACRMLDSTSRCGYTGAVPEVPWREKASSER